MGIRIHKVLGYGLTDVQYDEKNWEITDPRFNPNGYFGIQDVFDREEAFTDKGFDEYVNEIDGDTGDKFNNLYILQCGRKEALEKNGHTSKNGDLLYNYKDSIESSVTYDSEYGDSNIMVFTPPYWGKYWIRYDDSIDYYDSQHYDEDGGIINGHQMLNRPIYPFDGYQDNRTTPPTIITHTDFRLYVDSRDFKKSYANTMRENLKERMAFNSDEEIEQAINPIIPLELVELLKYLKVFNDEKIIYTLRPMLYWYWGG
ncbi:hypothetical protein MNBD_GAMMA08-1552 [hydrothermal vent metagenome]|uniref:Uncharacterized protein n=1 Tax=hydrothermal vent metagenome TaxID=652676 RepID=A0A3B0XBL3_9ZZZZ